MPYKSNKGGFPINLGPKGSLLEGAVLNNEESLAVICTVVYMTVKSVSSDDIPGISGIMTKHPKSVAAGYKITKLYYKVQQISPSQVDKDPPSFWSIIEASLKDPELRADDYFAKILQNYANKPTDEIIDDSDEDADEDFSKDSGETGRPRPQGRMAYRGRKASTPLKTHKKEVVLKNSKRGVGIKSKSKEDEDDARQPGRDKEEGGEDDSGMESWTSRPYRTANQAHKPAETGTWKLAEGSDKSKAKLGEPDTSKFFILRQDQDDPRHFDVREYTYIRTFDWNEKSHIDALNKSRTQIFERTDPSSITSRPQWSLKEKEFLESLIKADLVAGKNRLTLDVSIHFSHFLSLFSFIYATFGLPSKLHLFAEDPGLHENTSTD